MPTTKPRIGVIRDDQLDLALRRAAAILGPEKPAAALVRELALRGAESLADEDDAMSWLQRNFPMRPARGSLTATLRRLGPPEDFGGPTTAEILDELRDERR